MSTKQFLLAAALTCAAAGFLRAQSASLQPASKNTNNEIVNRTTSPKPPLNAFLNLNRTQSMLSIAVPGVTIVEMKIFSDEGRLIRKKMFSGTTQLNLELLNRGGYTLYFEAPNGQKADRRLEIK